MLEFDPIASMRIWAIEASLGAYDVRIPPLPAADWIPYLMRMDVMGIFDLAKDIDLDELLIDEKISADQARDCAIELLESAAGRSAWAAMALAALAQRYWPVVGADLARASVKFDQISLGAALDAIYGALIRGLDEKAIKRLNNILEHVPAEFQLAMGRKVTQKAPQRPVKPLPPAAEQYIRTRPKTVLRKPSDRIQHRPPSSNQTPQPT